MDIATAQSMAASRHLFGLTSEQSLYNLSASTIELEVITACRHYGLGLIPWSPIGMGLLVDALQKASEGRRASPLLQMRIEQHRPQLLALSARKAPEFLAESIGAADVELTTDDSSESENAVSELVVKRVRCPVHLQRLIDRLVTPKLVPRTRPA